ncbi:MAG: TIGR02679 domain-containing protein [Eubacteriales bacterium]|nr:TIGR02679 domain-containing protein [Eubacteriales bacterium]
MESENKILEECVAYFRARPVYRKLFRGFRGKYEGLGHFGGSVTLSGLSAEEKRDLGGFLQKDYAGNKSVTVSAARMEQALARSRFAGLDWKDILETYYGEPLRRKKDRKRQQEEERERFFREILESGGPGRGEAWLRGVLWERGEGWALLLQRYKENPKELQKELSYVLQAIERLPAFCGGEKELLPVFAARITGDPHFFDGGRTAERLLTSFLQRQTGERGEELSRTEYKNRLFYEAGVLRDDLSNDVLAYGVRAWRRDGSLHLGIEGFYQAHEPVKLTLRTLGGLGKIRAGGRRSESCAGDGSAEDGKSAGGDRNAGSGKSTDGDRSAYGARDRVYVVENPAVFSVLVEKHPDWTVLCGNGQLKLVVLVLMDQLAGDSDFFYMGDFDPEGLLIAQRLKQRYPACLELWNYKVSWYESYCSEVLLSDARLRKLDRIRLPELREMAEAMRRKRRAAYQEAITPLFHPENS